MKLSVVLTTRNEESNIGPCLESVKSIANEIIVVDEKSTDETAEIARKLGAKIYEVDHEPIFHINKQKALNLASGDWVLQLDADERVSPELAREIRKVIDMSNEEIVEYQKIQNSKNPKLQNLFARHQKLIEKREGKLGVREMPVVAFFIPRRNYFLGKPLIHAGVYPDGVIRLIKRGFAKFPAKSVHELMEVNGEIGWLFNDLEHHDSPTLKRYLDRMNRYTDLQAEEFKQKRIPLNTFYMLLYTSYIPAIAFLKLYLRHRGYLDGMRGFVWSFFSALHFPIAYFKYWQYVHKG